MDHPEKDYAMERQERAAELAINLMARRKDGGGYHPKPREPIVRTSKKTIIPQTEKSGQEIRLALDAPAQESGDHPFKIDLYKEGDSWKYTLSNGSITDGTNGDAVGTGLVEEEQSASAGSVYIEATIADGAVSAWALVNDSVNAEEVKFDEATPPKQNAARLYIGEIIEDEDDPDILTVKQALFTSVRLTDGFLNGSLVKVFESAPTHPDVF